MVNSAVPATPAKYDIRNDRLSPNECLKLETSTLSVLHGGSEDPGCNVHHIRIDPLFSRVSHSLTQFQGCGHHDVQYQVHPEAG